MSAFMVERRSKQSSPCEEEKQNSSLSFFSLVLAKMLSQFKEVNKPKSNGKSMDDHYQAVLNSRTATQEQKAKALELMEGPTIKEKAIRMMDYLGLPRYSSFKTTVAKALNLSAEEIKERVNSPSGRYYTNITKQRGGRVFELDQDINRVVPYIKEMYDFGEVEKEDEPIVNDFLINRESLNVIIGKDGHVYIEMIHGKHTGIAYGRRSPEMIVRKSIKNDSFSKFNWENRGISLNDEEFVALSCGHLPDKLSDSFDSTDHLHELMNPEWGKIYLSKSEKKRVIHDKVPRKMKKYFETFEDFCAVFDWIIKEETLSKLEIEQIRGGELPDRLKGIFPSIKSFLDYALERNSDLVPSKKEIRRLIKGELPEEVASEIYSSLSWENRTINLSKEDVSHMLKGELPVRLLEVFGSLHNFYMALDKNTGFSTNLLLTDEELANWQQLVFRILRRIPKDNFRSEPELGSEKYNEIYAERTYAPGYYEVIVSEVEEVNEKGETVTRTIIKFLDRRDVDNYGFRNKEN